MSDGSSFRIQQYQIGERTADIDADNLAHGLLSGSASLASSVVKSATSSADSGLSVLAVMACAALMLPA